MLENRSRESLYEKVKPRRTGAQERATVHVQRDQLIAKKGLEIERIVFIGALRKLFADGPRIGVLVIFQLRSIGCQRMFSVPRALPDSRHIATRSLG